MTQLHDTHAIPEDDEPLISKVGRLTPGQHLALIGILLGRSSQDPDLRAHLDRAASAVLADAADAEQSDLETTLNTAPGVGIRADRVLLYAPCCCGLSHETSLTTSQARGLASALTNHADHIAPA